MAKKKMLKFSPELDKVLGKALHGLDLPVSRMKMFGHDVWFLNGYMFSGANEMGIFLHLNEEMRDTAIADDNRLLPFEPMEGMIMREYLLLSEEICSDSTILAGWLQQSARYLLSLPKKKKKKKRKKS